MSAQPGSNTAPLRVLLVDDERLARLRLTGLLAEMAEPVPEVVGEAGTAAEALARVADCHPDLVLLDIQMPGMNGWELAQRLQARQPGLRALFITGYTPDAILQQGIALEPDLVLQKPFAQTALVARVQELRAAT